MNPHKKKQDRYINHLSFMNSTSSFFQVAFLGVLSDLMPKGSVTSIWMIKIFNINSLGRIFVDAKLPAEPLRSSINFKISGGQFPPAGDVPMGRHGLVLTPQILKIT